MPTFRDCVAQLVGTKLTARLVVGSDDPAAAVLRLSLVAESSAHYRLFLMIGCAACINVLALQGPGGD
jgi:hypothetical protein